MHYDKSRKRTSEESDREPRSCSVTGCSRPQYAQGLCRLHHDARRRAAALAARSSSASPSASPPAKRCCVPNCTAPHHAKGYCKSHYSQLRRRGTVSEGNMTGPTCEIAGCGKPIVKNHRCAEHLNATVPLMTKVERLSEIKARHELMRREIERIKQSFEAEGEDEE